MQKYEKSLTDGPVESKNLDSSEPIIDPFFLIIRKWKFILGVTLATVAIAVTITILSPPVYEVETTLMVSSGQLYSVNKLGNQEMLRNQKLVSTYTEMAKNRSILVSVINKLDLEMEPEKIADLLKVEPLGETELIKISFRDPNPKVAALLVDAISKELIEKATVAMTFQNLKIIDKAKVPDRPVSKKLPIVGGASFVLGILLGGALAFALELLYGKMMKPEDFEKIMGCQILAYIPNYDNLKKRGENEQKK